MSTPTKVLVSGERYMIFKHDGIKDELPVGVYQIGFSQTGPFLTKDEDIELPEKIYSNDTIFINHVMKSWGDLNQGNLGLGLVGGKGLGKSLTANVIAKKTGLPVIKLSQFVGDTSFIDYIKQLDQDFVLFIDEFEKLFPKGFDSDDNRASQEQLLSFLDGGTLKSNRILFIITSNSKNSISDFMKNRPSRLRYFKEYILMDERVIKEVIDDLLENRDYLEDLLENLPYNDINMDSLIKIIEEINLHNQPYSEFREFFNFEPTTWLNYDVSLVLENGEQELILPGHGSVIYNHSACGYSKKLFRNRSVRIYAHDETITENPKEPTKISGYYFHPTEKDKNGEYLEIPVELIVSPVVLTLSSKYVDA